VKQVVILSGKGGTGKTSLTAALAHLAHAGMNLVLADADVDAANLDLLLDPEKLEEHDFTGGFKAVIHGEACTACGRCFEVCRFGAVIEPKPSGKTYGVDESRCEGCNTCIYQCPEKAISNYRPVAGKWFRSSTPYGTLFHAEMNAGEENSGKLVSIVRKEAAEACVSTGCDLVLVDGPPGVGCPVIASCSGVDAAVITTEPGISSIHDLVRVAETLALFHVKPAVCINKSDINPKRRNEIVEFCSGEGITFLGDIPFDENVMKALSMRVPVTAAFPESPAASAVADIWNRLRTLIEYP